MYEAAVLPELCRQTEEGQRSVAKVESLTVAFRFSWGGFRVARGAEHKQGVGGDRKHMACKCRDRFRGALHDPDRKLYRREISRYPNTLNLLVAVRRMPILVLH
jgi:hypothetical protein